MRFRKKFPYGTPSFKEGVSRLIDFGATIDPSVYIYRLDSPRTGQTRSVMSMRKFTYRVFTGKTPTEAIVADHQDVARDIDRVTHPSMQKVVFR